MEPPAPAVEFFLGRLQKALAAVSQTSIRTRTSGKTVFFEFTGLPTRSGQLAFSGRLTVESGGTAFEGFLERFALRGEGIQWELKQAARIRCAPDGRVAVDEFEVDGPSGRIAASGSIWPDGEFSLALRLAGVGLQAFFPFLEAASAGSLDAELALRGDWESFFTADGAAIDMVLSAGRLRTEAGLPPIEPLYLNARLEGHSLLIQSCEGWLGEAPFRVAGRIKNPLTLSENGFVDLSIDGDNLLLYRTEAMRVRAAADLRLAGPFARIQVNGALSITEGRYEEDVGLLEGLRGAAHRGPAARLDLFSIRSQPLRNAEFDLAINATKPFEITNNRIRAVAYPTLQLTGTGEKPILTGRVAFGPTTLYLPGGRMQFERGVVRFDPPNHDRPWLEFNGYGRLQGYDVRAVVEGPYDRPEVTLSSSPSLPNEELLLLVLSGQTPTSRRISDSERSRHLDVAVLLGKEMVARIEGPRSNDPVQSVMDRFDVEVGHSPTRSGDETVRVLFRIANGIFSEGDTLYMAGEKDAFGYFNGGVRIAFRFR